MSRLGMRTEKTAALADTLVEARSVGKEAIVIAWLVGTPRASSGSSAIDPAKLRRRARLMPRN